MSLGVKLKSILEYYKEQIKIVMDVMNSTYDILKNEYIQIRDQLNTEDYRKKYSKYIKVRSQLEKSTEGTGIYLTDDQLEISEKIHQISDAKINFHSCGAIAQFIPHFTEIGYDIVNPVQISAYDMEPCSLKKRFGNRMSFWGGLCNSQKTLPFGTPKQIREEVRRNFECLKPGGGFVASNIHNITAEVPPQNIVAMFDAANEFRNY